MLKKISSYIKKSPKTLRDYEKRILLVFFICFVVSTIFSVLMVFISYNEIERKENLYFASFIDSKNSILQKDLSEKLKMVFNSTDFFYFINAGTYSQKINSIIPEKLFQHISNNGLIQGITVSKNGSETILSQGRTSNLYIIIDLCYLNNTIDSVFGECKYKATLYFSKNAYVEQLTNENIDMTYCRKDTKRCYMFNPFKKSLADFPVKKSFGEIVFKNKPSLSFLIFPLIVVIAISIIALYINQKFLRYFSGKYLSKPIQTICEKIKKYNLKDMSEIDVSALDEIKFLTNEIIEHERNKALVYFGKIIIQIAHDIRTPIIILDICMKHIESLSQKELAQMKLAVNDIKYISENLLSEFNIIKMDENHASSMSNSLPILLEQIISQKKMQFQSTKVSFHLKIRGTNSSLLIDERELKRVLSNLINNSVDSFEGKSGIIKIMLFSNIKKTFIIIKDNGCGIPHDLPGFLEPKLSREISLCC